MMIVNTLVEHFGTKETDNTFVNKQPTFRFHHRIVFRLNITDYLFTIRFFCVNM